jgi:hypothetical protein
MEFDAFNVDGSRGDRLDRMSRCRESCDRHEKAVLARAFGFSGA